MSGTNEMSETFKRMKGEMDILFMTVRSTF